MEKLKITSLSKSFKSYNQTLPVLNSLDLAVKKGEFVCILGPSGCGKSTFFNIISGLQEPDTGSIEIDGKKYQNRRGHTGYMFQQPLLLPWRTSLENILIGLELKGMPKEKAKEKASNLLSEFGLSAFSSFYPDALSGGMKQKVALLRTIAFNSELLLLDEPFGSLDALSRFDLQNYLLSIWQKLNLTILFVTHDVHEALYLADQVIVLSQRPAKIIKTVKVKVNRSKNLSRFSSSRIAGMEEELIRLLSDKTSWSS